MKKILILFLFLEPLKISLWAQTPKDSIVNYSELGYWSNFETDYRFIHFDSSTIWQIGMPTKEFCDSAYSMPNALCSDTLNSLLGPVQSSFLIKYYRPGFSQTNCIRGFGLSFITKYELNDSSGIFIEISYDKGIAWTNFFDDSHFSGVEISNIPYTTLINRQKGFNGINTIWDQYFIEKIYPETFGSAGSITSVFLKITIFNSSHQGIGGIVIDNIEFSGHHWCEFLDVAEYEFANSEIKVTPNPAKSDFTIDVSSIKTRRYSLNIYDINGRPILSRFDECEQKLHFSKGTFPKGIYMVVVKTAEGKMFTKKFVVE